MTRVFFITDSTIDGKSGEATHVRELFENLQQFTDAYLLAPYAANEPDDERILSVPTGLLSIPVLRTVLFRLTLLTNLAYQTVRRSPDAFYLRQSPLGLFPPLVAKAVGLPLVVEVNGILANEHDSASQRTWLTGVILAIERITFRFADQFVAVTPEIAEYVHRRYGVPRDRITHVSNGANVGLFSPRDKRECVEELGLEPDAALVCFVGKLAPWQGVDNLIRSFSGVRSRVPDAKLLIVGEGDQRDELEALAEELDLEEDVIFTGAVPYESVPRYVSASDVAVVYKVPMESGYSPLKLYEYMACGRPVVASDTSGFGVVDEHDAGLLVPPEDPDALAEAITTLLRDQDARETMGKNGREYVVNHRSWENTAENVAKVIETTVGEQ